MRKIQQPSLPEEATIPVRRSIGDQMLTSNAANSQYKVTFEPRTSRTLSPTFSCDFFVEARTKEAARILAERGLLARYPDFAFCFHAPDICHLSARDFHVKREARLNAVSGTLMHSCALFALFDDEPEYLTTIILAGRRQLQSHRGQTCEGVTFRLSIQILLLVLCGHIWRQG